MLLYYNTHLTHAIYHLNLPIHLTKMIKSPTEFWHRREVFFSFSTFIKNKICLLVLQAFLYANTFSKQPYIHTNTLNLFNLLILARNQNLICYFLCSNVTHFNSCISYFICWNHLFLYKATVPDNKSIIFSFSSEEVRHFVFRTKFLFVEYPKTLYRKTFTTIHRVSPAL